MQIFHTLDVCVKKKKKKKIMFGFLSAFGTKVLTRLRKKKTISTAVCLNDF